MKKTLTVIVLLSFLLNIYSQVPPSNKRTNLSATSINSKSVAKSKKALNNNVDKETAPFYLEIKLLKSEKRQKVIIPKAIYKQTKNIKVLKRMKELEMLTRLAEEDNFNLISSMNERGFKFLSHTFVLNKSEEIHYYIFEL
ncbi:MAG: hypothetical protein ACI8ZX_000858 [Planctomycetota bacterium]|jgi:hypothetical protein